MPQTWKVKSLTQISIALAAFLFCNVDRIPGVQAQDPEDDPGDPVYLTPIIREGDHVRAQEAALVIDFYPVLSYSGFITVNEEYNSNIFFWFFPAEQSLYNEKSFQDNDFPVVLYTEGGPGISTIYSIFGQTGPFTGDSNGINYTSNPFSWHKKYHMIYIDNPVDVGYSHTGNENGYVTSAEGAAKDIYEFLSQFFALFPNLQRNPFYNSGSSFGANYAIHSAFYTHQQNLNNPTRIINLTGVIVDSPWIDPYTQSHYGDYLYNVGLINEKSRDEFIANETRIRGLIDDDKYLEAFQLAIITSMVSPPQLTGYTQMSNIIHEIPAFINMTAFAVANSTRKALHVGSLGFKFVSQEQQSRMHPNFMRSAKTQLDSLMEAGYKFLIYVGNMDVTTNHLGVQRMLKTLSWSGGRDLADGTREIWRVNDKLAGYRTSSGKGTFAIIRNAGHGCAADQPEEVLDVVSMFTENGN